MAQEQIKFVEIEIGSLSTEQRAAWDMLMAAKAEFKATLQSLAPAGRKIVFSDKYNKLKIAVTAAPKANADKPKLNLSQWLDQQATL